MKKGKKRPTRKAPTQKTELPSAKQAAFLAAYALSGNISAAAKLAKIHRSDHYGWMDDPDYCEKFSQAHEEAIEQLELEARRRALHGVDEPVVYQGGFSWKQKKDPETGEWVNDYKSAPLAIRKYSDTLLIFLLKGAKPDKYRDQWKGEISGPGGLPLNAPKIDLSNLTDEQLELLEQLAKAAAKSQRDRGREEPEGEE